MRSLDRAARVIGWDWASEDVRAMRRRRGGVSALERIEALLANPALYELADLVPEPGRTRVVVLATTRPTCGCSTKR